MIKVKDPNQLDIFDPWAILTPKRRQLLDSGWPGLFREHILPCLPVHNVAQYFNETFKLAQVFKINADKQRIDSVHIKSNMRR